MKTAQSIIREMIEEYKHTEAYDDNSKKFIEIILQEALSRIEKETGWISVEERLPEKEWRYIVLDEDISFDYFLPLEWFEFTDATHWMPIPLSPNQ